MRDKSIGRDRPGAVGQDEAEGVAVEILIWLAGQADLMSRFLAVTGVDASAIRQAASEPGFLAAVTGFVMAHEPTLMDFCAANNTAAERVAACHHRLAGPPGESST
jgi:hypothetical protein